MKKLVILIVGIIACRQEEPAAKAPASGTDNKEFIKTTLAKVAPPGNSIDYNDSTIYKEYIPEAILNVIKQKLPEWHLLKPADWEMSWFNEYKKKSSLVSYCTADFNCDGKDDYAIMLGNNKNEITVWIIQSDNNNYKTVRLDELGQIRSPIQFGIDTIPKGKLDYIDLDVENVKTINIKCPAVQVVYFESAAVAYYWEKGKYQSVQTAD